MQLEEKMQLREEGHTASTTPPKVGPLPSDLSDKVGPLPDLSGSVEEKKAVVKAVASVPFTQYHRYLINTIDKIDECLSHDAGYSEPSPWLLEAASFACHRLDWLLNDSLFSEDLRQLSGISSIPSDLKQFSDDFEEFLVLEHELLLKGGIAPTTANRLISQCDSLLSAGQLQKTVDPTKVTEAVKRLRDQTYQLAQELRQQTQDKEQRQRSRQKLRRIAMGIGGAALIGLNCSFLALTLGLSAALIQVSGTVGGGLLLKSCALPD